jgi:transposase
LEATGPYSHALALWLLGQGHRVSLLNPRRVKYYARSAGNRNKTDLLDAAVIADFVCALKPAAWQPPTLEVAHLQALVRRREELSLMLQAQKNRLKGIAPNVRSSLERMIATLSAKKARLEKLITQRSALTSSSPAIINCPAPSKESARSRPPSFWPKCCVPVKSSAHVRLPLMQVWFHGAKKAALPCVATEV